MKSETFNKEVNLFKDEVVRMVKASFNADGKFPPTVFAYSHVEDSNVQPIAVMTGFAHVMDMPMGRDMVRHAVRDMVKKTKPIALAFVMKANATKMELIEGESVEEMKERYFSNRESMPKEENLVIGLETYCTEYTIRYVINRDGEKPTLEFADDGATWDDKPEESGMLQNFIQECYVDIEQDKANLSKLN